MDEARLDKAGPRRALPEAVRKATIAEPSADARALDLISGSSDRT